MTDWSKPAVGQWNVPSTKGEIREYLSKRDIEPPPPPPVVQPAPRPRMSAGFRSTEFWLAMAACWSGLLLLLVGLVRPETSLALGGAALIALSSVAYSHSRGKAKGRPYLPPVGRL